MGGTWSVDPDRVAGVLRGVDDQGSTMESSYSTLRKAIDDAESALVVEGRQVMLAGWNEFWSVNRSVPGKMMHAIVSASEGITQATVTVVAGDENMTTETARQRVVAEWDFPNIDQTQMGWETARSPYT